MDSILNSKTAQETINANDKEINELQEEATIRNFLIVQKENEDLKDKKQELEKEINK